MARQTGRAGDMRTQSRIKVKPRCRFPKQMFQRYLQSKQTNKKAQFLSRRPKQTADYRAAGGPTHSHTHTTCCLTDTHLHTHTNPHKHTSPSTHGADPRRYTAPHTHPSPGAPTEAGGMLRGRRQRPAPTPFLTPPSCRRPSACAAAASPGAGPFHSRPRACPETVCGS